MADLNLGRLQVFDAVARTGTFAEAARVLSFTPSAVSQQMARLEAELGTTLVERTARGVRLTGPGTVLLERTRRILDEAWHARRQLEDLAALRGGVLSMGSFASATQSLCTRVLRLYAARHTGVEVRLTEDAPAANLLALRSGLQEVALLYAYPGRPVGADDRDQLAAAEDGVVLERFARDPFVAVVPDGHRLAGRGPIAIADLVDEIIVGTPRTPGMDQLLLAMDGLGASPLFTGHAVRDYQSVRALAACGDGIGVVPRLATAHPFAGTATLEICGAVPFRHVVIGHVGAERLSPAGAAMLRLLAEIGPHVAPPHAPGVDNALAA